MMPLKVMDPGGSLSMLLSPLLKGKTPVREGILAFGNGGGHPSAVEPAGGCGLRMALDFKNFAIFIFAFFCNV
jgi:hypothetical protein